MKRIVLIPAIALGALFAKTADAQIGINVGFHLGNAHIAARVAQAAPDQYYGDDDYYYLPDVGAYYDVNDQSYFYNDGDNWVSAAYLPGYANYDWRNFRRYEVRANRPYLRDEYYRGQYNGHIGNWGRNDERAYANRDFRGDERRFDNRENFGRGQTERFNTPREFEQFNNNRGNRGGEQAERFNNPRQFEQPQQNNGRENFNRPSMGERGMGQMNQRENHAPAQNGGENHGQWNRGSGGHAI